MQLTPTGTAQVLFGILQKPLWYFWHSCLMFVPDNWIKEKQTTKHPHVSPEHNLPCSLYNVLWSDSTTSPKATQLSTARGFLPLMPVCQDCVILLFVSAVPWATNCTLLYLECTSEMSRACCRVVELGARCCKNAFKGSFFFCRLKNCLLLFALFTLTKHWALTNHSQAHSLFWQSSFVLRLVLCTAAVNAAFNQRSLTRCLYCRALCYLTLKQHKEAVQDCTEALRLDPKNVKAFYRRAQALKELKVSQEFLTSFQVGACECPLAHVLEQLHRCWCSKAAQKAVPGCCVALPLSLGVVLQQEP